MQTITLYRYSRTDGGVSVSPVKPDGEYTERFRIVADEGMMLTDGENFTTCTDTESPAMWAEVVGTGGDPNEEIPGDEFLSMMEGVL